MTFLRIIMVLFVNFLNSYQMHNEAACEAFDQEFGKLDEKRSLRQILTNYVKENITDFA